MDTKIQIVIPAINLWNKYTKPAINSVVQACEGLDYRIILIDNGSTDETLIEAGRLVSANFSHHRNKDRWSCAKSWNFGIRDAFERGYDYVFVINNDVLIHKDAIKSLVTKFKDDIVMATCMDVRGEVNPPEKLFDLKSEDYSSLNNSDHPNFSAFMISKKYWDEIGEFDEGFAPAYFEDNDAHHRVVKSQLRAITVPTALFYHYGSRTQNEADVAPIVSSDAFLKNRAYYISKWGGPPGEETYEHSFNNDSNSIKLTKQNV